MSGFDGQWHIAVGELGQALGQEGFARHRRHGVEDRFIADSQVAQFTFDRGAANSKPGDVLYTSEEMDERIVTVFGGTGFLGRRLVRAIAGANHRVRIAARNPGAARFPEVVPEPEHVVADVTEDDGVAEALDGAFAAVNAVSLYDEREGLSFDAVHVEGAARVARHCGAAGVRVLVHLSGIGANRDSESALVRAKARGEEAVHEEFSDATIFRPSVMFGREDAFIANIEAATRAPVVPLFGRGEMRLQPAWVQDVARAAAEAVEDNDSRGTTYELGGAKVLSYREAVEAVCAALGRRRLLLPFPMAGWRALVWAMRILPNPPLNKDQLHLLAAGNTASDDRPGFSELGVRPVSLLDKLEYCLS